jgi:uncharacterized protein YqeY
MLTEQIQKDIIVAMKAKDEHTLVTLRMAKSAINGKEKDKREPLTEPEVEAVLSTLIKQRKDSAEQFTTGNRPELAARELAEIKMLEKYLPLEATKPQLVTTVCHFIEGLASAGTPVTPKLMGSVIKGVKDQLAVANLRADGAMLSGIVKEELTNWKG